MEKLQSAHSPLAITAPTNFMVIVASAVADLQQKKENEESELKKEALSDIITSSTKLKAEPKPKPEGGSNILNQHNTDQKDDNVSEREQQEKALPQKAQITINEKNKKESEDNDDDENVPLLALKLVSTGADTSSNTTTTIECPTSPPLAENVSLKFWIELLHHISLTWGHVYKEASHFDHAWQWEILYSQHDKTRKRSSRYWLTPSTTPKRNNPRMPNVLIFEKIRFVLDQHIKFMENDDYYSQEALLDNTNNTSTMCSSNLDNNTNNDTRELITHLISPQTTGLYDALLALLQTKVLTYSKDQKRVVLADQWFRHVSCYGSDCSGVMEGFLDEVLYPQLREETGCGINKDNNPHRINELVWTTLHKHWKLYVDEADEESGWVQGGGWILQGKSMKMTSDKWQELRKTFERDWNRNEETTIGVGRFF
uniref:Uncharacterized protein n=1 Tax=Proboscia inermis TaxID=420281 RepID=A0A7S0GKL2_9STRA